VGNPQATLVPMVTWGITLSRRQLSRHWRHSRSSDIRFCRTPRICYAVRTCHNKLGIILLQYTVRPLLVDLCGGNLGSDKPIRRLSGGKGNVVVDIKEQVEDKGINSRVEKKNFKTML
jgi:hypothetical protein